MMPHSEEKRDATGDGACLAASRNWHANGHAKHSPPIDCTRSNSKSIRSKMPIGLR